MNEKQAKRLRKAIYSGESSAAKGTRYVVIGHKRWRWETMEEAIDRAGMDAEPQKIYWVEQQLRTVGKRSLYQALKRGTGMAVDYEEPDATPAAQDGLRAP